VLADERLEPSRRAVEGVAFGQLSAARPCSGTKNRAARPGQETRLDEER
jgi:hypothetical protein